METNFSVLFHGKKNIAKNEKLITIYVRITVNGERLVFSTHRTIEVSNWSREAEKVKGNSDEAKSINSYLDTLKHKAYQFQKELILEEKSLNKKTFRDKWMGIKEKPKLLLELFEQHNEQIKALIDKSIPHNQKNKMENIAHSPAFLRKRKFLIVLPLLVLPFVVMFFAALGGGKGSTEKKDVNRPGINTSLPNAHFKGGKEKDKLALYDEANKDSLRRRAAFRNDPWQMRETDTTDLMEIKSAALQRIFQQAAGQNLKNINADPNAEKLQQKLSQLKKVLNQQSSVNSAQKTVQQSPVSNNLENVEQMINARSNEPDPEINKLSGMLDKIMLIQHPESLQDSMRRLSEKNKAQTFVVRTAEPGDNISLLGSSDGDTFKKIGFYGLNDETSLANEKQNCIEAVIPETQTLVSGATVKLRLLNDIFINGMKISKDEFVYGTATLSNERLKIAINSIRFENNILPVSLSVYDMDGMAGIYIPGSINRDVSKESADDAVSTLGLTTVDQSPGAQATQAGIEAAKTLASRKIRLIRLTVQSGYRVLLKDANTK
jgi:conjugative transposon TraM protein